MDRVRGSKILDDAPPGDYDDDMQRDSNAVELQLPTGAKPPPPSRPKPFASGGGSKPPPPSRPKPSSGKPKRESKVSDPSAPSPHRGFAGLASLDWRG